MAARAVEAPEIGAQLGVHGDPNELVPLHIPRLQHGVTLLRQPDPSGQAFRAFCSMAIYWRPSMLNATDLARWSRYADRDTLAPNLDPVAGHQQGSDGGEDGGVHGRLDCVWFE